MNFERIFGANVDFGPPRGWDKEKDGECGTLPVRVNTDEGTCASAWKPSDDEMRTLIDGGFIILTIHGRQPVVSVHVEMPDGERT